MKNNHMRLEFKSCAENERFARQVAAAFVAELNPTLDEICDIKTAISEAVTNAIIHGYQNQDGIVTLSANYIGNTVEISVEDKGIGIDDVDRAREPLYTSQAGIGAVRYGIYRRWNLLWTL